MNFIRGLFGGSEESEESAEKMMSKVKEMSPEEIDRRLSETRKKFMEDHKLKKINADKNGGFKGLQNRGNTCYMASALQCIAALPELRDHFLSLRFVSNLNTLTSPTKGDLAVSLYHLFEELWSENSSSDSVGLRDVKSSMGRVNPQFLGYGQQDSQEFISILLDALNDELNRVIVKPYEMIRDQEKDEGVTAYADYIFANHLKRNSSIVSELFHGQFVSRTVCPTCQHLSLNCDPLEVLSLDISSESGTQFDFYYVPWSTANQNLTYSVNLKNNMTLKQAGDLFSQSINELSSDSITWCQLSAMKINNYPPDDTSLIRDIQLDKRVVFMYQNSDQKVWQKLFGQNDGPSILVELSFIWDNQSTGIERVLKVPLSATIFQLKYLSLLVIWRCLFIEKESISIPDTYEFVDTDESWYEKTVLEIDEFIKSKEEEWVFKLLNKYNLREIDEDKYKTVSHFKSKKDDIVRVVLEMNSKVTPDLKSMKRTVKANMSDFNNNVVKNDECISLEECMRRFKQWETLDEENMWFCPKCKEHKMARKQIGVVRFPKFLIIHLKRFRKRAFMSYGKNKSKVSFPLENISMNEIAIDCEDPPSYFLRAISNHYGDVGGGHYTAYVRHNHSNWMEKDDSTVSAVNHKQVCTPEAYVLFLERYV